MTEREKLRELIYAWELDESKVSIADCDTDKSIERLIDKLLANGVIVPPCKVGDKACYLTTVDTLTELGVAEIFEGNIFSVTNDLTDMWIFCRYSNGLTYYHKESDIGKTVFLTREEAEKALSERSET